VWRAIESSSLAETLPVAYSSDSFACTLGGARAAA